MKISLFHRAFFEALQDAECKTALLFPSSQKPLDDGHLVIFLDHRKWPKVDLEPLNQEERGQVTGRGLWIALMGND